MQISRTILMIAGIIFGILGLICLLSPLQMQKFVLFQFPTPASVTEFRAVYGGLEIGLGIFLLYCALKSGYALAGIIAMTASFGGFLLGRTLGILLDGHPQKITLISMILELFGTLVGIIMLLNEGQRKTNL